MSFQAFLGKEGGAENIPVMFAIAFTCFRQKISSGSGGPQFAFHLRTASSLGKSLEASSVAISHVIPTVIRTMTAMSASIRDHEHMVDFLLRLLTMFNTLGLSSVQETAVAAAKSETGGKQFMLSQNYCFLPLTIFFAFMRFCEKN